MCSLINENKKATAQKGCNKKQKHIISVKIWNLFLKTQYCESTEIFDCIFINKLCVDYTTNLISVGQSSYTSCIN